MVEEYGLVEVALAAIMVSLIYFFGLVLRFSHLLSHTASEGETRPLRPVHRGDRATV